MAQRSESTFSAFLSGIGSLVNICPAPTTLDFSDLKLDEPEDEQDDLEAIGGDFRCVGDELVRAADDD